MRTMQEGFASGEISSSMEGQSLNPLLSKSVRYAKNFEIMPQGPAFVSPGYHLRYRAGSNSFLIPFLFSETESYVLEFFTSKMRVHKNVTTDTASPWESLVFDDSITVTNISTAAEAVATSAGHGWSNGDHFVLAGNTRNTVGMPALIGEIFQVSDVTADTFKFKNTLTTAYVSTVDLPAYVASGTDFRAFKVLEVDSPYALFNDLAKIQYAQTGNVMYLVHPSFKPREVTRVSDTNWTITEYTPTNDLFTSANNYPSAVFFMANRLYFLSSNSHPLGVWGTKANDFNNMTQGSNDDDGFFFVLNTGRGDRPHWGIVNDKQAIIGTNGGCRRFSGATPDTSPTPTAVEHRSADDIGAARVFPISKSGRVVFAQMDRKRLRSLILAQSGEGYESLDLNIVSDEITREKITQLAKQNGEMDQIWCILDNGEMAGMTINFSENIYSLYRRTTTGSFKSMAVIPDANGRDVMWSVVQRTVGNYTDYFIETKTHNMEYAKREDFFTGDREADDNSYRDSIHESQKHHALLDGHRKYDGSIIPELLTASLTLSTNTEGDEGTATSSQAIFLSSDVGKLIVYKNGRGIAEITGYTSSTVVDVEIINEFPSTAIASTRWYLTTDTITNLWMYEGETLNVIADGGEHDDVVVEDGEVTLSDQYSVVFLGLKNTSILIGNILDIQGYPGGPINAKPKKLKRLGIKFKNSIGLTAGGDLYTQREIPWRDSTTDSARPPYVKSETIDIPITDTPSTEKSFVIIQDKALPCTVVSAYPDFEVGK